MQDERCEKRSRAFHCAYSRKANCLGKCIFIRYYGKCPKNSNTKASDKMTDANSVDPDQTAPSDANSVDPDQTAPEGAV